MSGLIHDLIIFSNEIPESADFAATPACVTHHASERRYVRHFPDAPSFYMFLDETGVVDWIPVRYYKRRFASGLSKSVDNAPVRTKRQQKTMTDLKKALLTASGYEPPTREVVIPELAVNSLETADEEESENIAVSSSSEDEEDDEPRKKKKKNK